MSAATLLLRGTGREPSFALVDADGAAVDMTTANRRLVLRLAYHGASSPTLTRDTSVTADRGWTSQAGGTGWFILSAAAITALTEAWVVAEVLYYADASTDPKRVYGPIKWRVETLGTGAP